jgi:hypothetical protein
MNRIPSRRLLDRVRQCADRLIAITLGADKGCDATDFVEELCGECPAARGAEYVRRRPAIDQ